MGKSADAFRTISEVSDLLDTPTHVLRFWESKFTQVKPVKRAGGRRYYRPADVALLGGIKHLLHEEGMTIRGVQKLLREEGIREVAARGEVSVEDEREADEATQSASEPIAPVAAPQHSPAPQEEPQAQDATLGEPESTEAAPEEIAPQEEPPQEAASLEDSAQDTAQDESQSEASPERPEELLDLAPAKDAAVEAHQGGSVTPFPAPSQPSFFDESETASGESPEADESDDDAEAPMALDVEPEPEPMAPVVAMTIDRGPQERAAKIAARADLAKLLHGLRTLDPARLSPADRGDLRMLRLRAQALQARLAQHGSERAE
ncbi:DNA-binding transcriptional MerR regulator [Thioclava sp. ES.031]|uniref:MerR family transcriptional regulator n=1 Tax=Thioclava sp. ES.031 TaxID=1798203 RepID=UPI000BF7A374|nr:MerR family transcriptional regulator [Thioclava sp. ES.031]PFG63797.1 DNA-binding transcriptional MerR regulator [Thioclava sp. ES.031]